MSEVTGVVQEIQTRGVAGGKTAYNVVVAGQSYGAGLYAPKCKAGDYVKFEVDESRGYKNVARGSLKVSANKAPAEAVAEAEATAPKQSSTGGTFDTRQDTISRQASLNSAIAFMQLLSENEALGLPAANTKGKRQETLELMLRKYVQEFYEFNTGVTFKDISPTQKAEDTEAEPDVVDDVPDEKWD